MRGEPITVYVDDQPVPAADGVTVADLLHALPAAVRDAVRAGRLVVRDAHGYELGSGGALAAGARLYLSQPQGER